jgi:hypothetical protein
MNTGRRSWIGLLGLGFCTMTMACKVPTTPQNPPAGAVKNAQTDAKVVQGVAKASDETMKFMSKIIGEFFGESENFFREAENAKASRDGLKEYLYGIVAKFKEHHKGKKDAQLVQELFDADNEWPLAESPRWNEMAVQLDRWPQKKQEAVSNRLR